MSPLLNEEIWRVLGCDTRMIARANIWAHVEKYGDMDKVHT